MNQFQETLTPSQVSNNLERHATLLMELPQNLDNALTVAAEQRVQRPHTRGGVSQKQPHMSPVFIALLLVLVAVVLVSRHLETHHVEGIWMEVSSAVLFTVLGGLLFRAVSRSR